MVKKSLGQEKKEVCRVKKELPEFFESFLGYSVVAELYTVANLYSSRSEFNVATAYQRNKIWQMADKKWYLYTIVRDGMCPEIFLRRIRVPQNESKKGPAFIFEVVDGQQRITTLWDFLDDLIKVPEILGEEGLVPMEYVGKKFSQLPEKFQNWFKDRTLHARVVSHLDDHKDLEQCVTCSEIFRRLNATTGLKWRERLFAEITSLTRNTAVYYTGERIFDYGNYQMLDPNPNRLPFFDLLSSRAGDRRKEQMTLLLNLMEHFDPSSGNISGGWDNHRSYVDGYIQKEGGIGDYSYRNKAFMKELVVLLEEMYAIFSPGPLGKDQKVDCLRNSPFIKVLILFHDKQMKRFSNGISHEYKRLFCGFTHWLFPILYPPSKTNKKTKTRKKEPSSYPKIQSEYEINRHETLEEIGIRISLFEKMFKEYKRLIKDKKLVLRKCA